MTRIRWNWGTGIALVYLAFATGTLGFVAFAVSQPVQLVSADYYAQALSFDGRQAAVHRADALGSSLDVTLDGRTLRIRLPQDDASGSVALYRPSDAATDQARALAIVRGEQRLDLQSLAPGRWVVKMKWTSGGLDYYREQTLVLP